MAHRIVLSLLVIAACGLAADAAAQSKPRARDLGVPFDGTPGTVNAITDVAGVEVGGARSPPSPSATATAT